MKKKNVIILLVISIVCIIFVYHDYFLYKTPIVKVTNVENKIEKIESNKEKHYIQNITGIIMNGKYKGNKVGMINHYSTSLIYGDKIEKNSDVFVKLTSDGNKISSIESIKRDKYIVILFVIFIDLIILIAGKKGIKTLVSFFSNVAITIFAIVLFNNNYEKINILLLYLIISIIFIVLSLFITNGKSKKTLSAIISSIVALLLSFSLSFILVKIFGKTLNIWGMEYIDVVHDYHNFFYVCILLCGLGAIMDIAITISSSLNELIEKNAKISKKDLLKSGKVISKDIVGTMINVMLFTCYTSVIPTVLLAIKNNMPVATALNFYADLELTIVLCNCVGIALTIPVSLYISILILNNRKVVKK